MKITPDSSLFSALSNLPSPSDVRRRAPQERDAGFANKIMDPARQEKDARDAIVRQALRDAAQRQATLRQSRESKPEAAKLEAAAAAQQTTGVARAEGNGAQTATLRREVPFGDTKPTFVRLGQFIDISV